MVDWAQLYLFELIFMRMSGFLLFNPLLGRSNLPAMVKTGMALVLSILVFGTAGTGVPQPDTLVELAFRLLLELGIGLVLGFVMRVVFSVVQIGGEVIDTQMGMTMAQIYDASSQANLSVTASLLNILLILDFFAENGHYTLMRLLTTSGELVPYGAAALGDGVYAYVIELFLACMLLAVKLAMPILAAELLGEVGMGVLMKAIPQINAFVINIELKVIIGLLLFFLLLTPINEFLLELGDLIHRQTFDWTGILAGGEVIPTPFSLHCVNLAQGIKEPVVYYQRSNDPAHVAAVKKGFEDIRRYIGLPTGLYGGDEALHGAAPTQGSELCTAVEMMYSLEEMAEITGDVQFADHLERVAFNALPTQATDAYDARQYYQQVNQVMITDHRRNFEQSHDGTPTISMKMPIMQKQILYTGHGPDIHAVSPICTRDGPSSRKTCGMPPTTAGWPRWSTRPATSRPKWPAAYG